MDLRDAMQLIPLLFASALGDCLNISLTRLCFRGIYFPTLTKCRGVGVVIENRRTLLRLFQEVSFDGGSDDQTTETIALPSDFRKEQVAVCFAHPPPSISAAALTREEAESF